MQSRLQADSGRGAKITPAATAISASTEQVARCANRLRRKPAGTAHPMGPWLERATPVYPARVRLAALGILVVTAVVLGVAMWLEPDPSGLGTHRQLGAPGCSMPALTGLPCPTCGMTTAFAHTVRGELALAFHAQPAGFLLAVSCLIAALTAGWTVVSGSYWRLNWYRIRAEWVTVGVIGAILGGWGYKIVMCWQENAAPL